VDKYSKFQRNSKALSTLPLFNWRQAVLLPATSAGRFVHHRYNVSPEIADVVAAADGLGPVRQ
jgi:hypothetical protein